MDDFLVSASTGAVGSVLGKLGKLLSDEYKLLKGVRDDINFLESELQAMRAFLIMMARVEEPDEQSKLHVDVVRETSYEIEDSIDKFMVLVEHEPPSSQSDCFRNLCNKIMKKIDDMKNRHKIAKDVKRIKSQVKEISERYKRYPTNEYSRPKHEKVDPRVGAIFKDKSELIGVDGPRDELVEWISNKEHESSDKTVISIVGYGGLGKTTLAREVYDKLQTNYDCRAFVSISRKPDMTQILSSILSQLRGQDYAHVGELELIIRQIRSFLKDKRYFVIIDDVWDVPTSQILNRAFVRNGCGNVVLTTTRINDVAKSCCSSERDRVYQMKPLSAADSKKLFFKLIFGSEEKCPPNLKEASEGIIKRCDGLPLAIHALSSLLATRKTKEEWDHVQSSIEFSQAKNPDVNAMHYILSLSYFDLPLHLRSCLLYLTMFPEDDEIGRQPLVRKWIAEGLIYNKDGEDLVELGDSYFYELINRSLIHSVDIGYDGNASSCKVHDIVLDFLIHKSTEENFCTTLSHHHPKTNRRIRRLLLMGNEDEESVQRLDLSHARSLSSSGHGDDMPSLVKSNALRVLDLDNCYGLENHYFKDIGRLRHLRYLNIGSASITELPRQTGDLEFLETLDVINTRLVELPGSVTRLKRLARLFLPTETKLPDLIGNMKNLQELGRIDCSVQSLNIIKELGKLTDLRKLDITLWYGESDEDKDKERKLVSSLYKLQDCKLRYLSTTFYLGEDDEHWSFPSLNSIREVSLFDGQLSRITKWLVSLDNLQMLSVKQSRIEQQDIETVGSIPTLQELRLLLATTRGLMFEAGATPNLKKLLLMMRLVDVQSAGSGGGFDFGIQHLSGLISLIIQINIDGMSDADVEAAVLNFESMAGAHPNVPKLRIYKECTTSNISQDL